jgi:hypothetical protein
VISEMDSSDWSNRIRHHTFDTRSDTKFKHLRGIMQVGLCGVRDKTAQVPTENVLRGLM